MNKKPFLTQRAQMAFVGVGMWLLLAFWSLSAFWSHIDGLAESYKNGAKAGAMAGEFALLALVEPFGNSTPHPNSLSRLEWTYRGCLLTV